MIRIFAQLVLSLAMVEFVPTTVSLLETAHLPEARDGHQIVYEVERLISPSLPIDISMRAPVKVDVNSLGIVTSAASAIVVDVDSGAILFDKNIDEVRPIGSVTKLLAAAAFLTTNPDLSVVASILPEDIRAGGRDHLYLNDEVTVRDLLEASLVGSDNPATMSLMRLSGLSPEAFADRMNELVDKYEMRQSRFTEPTECFNSEGCCIVT